MRRLVAVALLFAAPLTMAPTCDNDFGRKGAGEPCTRDNECAEGLACTGGMCDARDGGPVDASSETD